MTAPLIGINGPILDDSQKQVVEVLEQALELARAGEINTVGVLACFKSGYASVHGGTDAGSLNLACDDLKRKILNDVTGSAKTVAAHSRILRAGRA